MDACDGLSTEQLCSFLKNRVPELGEDTLQAFQSAKITGEAFKLLQDENLIELGCTLGERILIKALIRKSNGEVSIVPSNNQCCIKGIIYT